MSYINRKAYYVYAEFDGADIVDGIITEESSGHVIMMKNGVSYWLEFRDLNQNWSFNKKKAEQILKKLKKENQCFL